MQHNPFFGRTMVWTAFTIAAFGWGVGFYGPPIYLKAVQDARGWSVGTVSGAVTTHFLAGVLIVANLPRLHRQFGLPLVTLAGSVALALGVVGWALAQTPWQLYAASLLSGMGWVTLGAAAINAIIAPWFIRKRPAALSTAYNGASIGGVVFSPLWVALIEWLGFPLAAALLGFLMVVVVASLAGLVLGRDPASMGQQPDGDTAEDASVAAGAPAESGPSPSPRLLADPAFMTVAAGMALALFAQIGLIAHLFSLIAPRLGAQGAGLAAGMATAAAILGRSFAARFMTPGADRRVIASLALAVQAVGCLVLIVGLSASTPLLLLGVFLIGSGIGNATSLPPLIIQVEFARSDVARAVALVVAIAQTAYAFAPAMFGLLREWTPESPTPLLFASILVQAVAIFAYLTGRGSFRTRYPQ